MTAARDEDGLKIRETEPKDGGEPMYELIAEAGSR